MGAAVSFAGSSKPAPKPKTEKKELRRRNSLASFITGYVRPDRGYAAQIEEVKRSIAINGTPDPRNSKLSRLAERIAQGNFRALREQVIQQWRTINRQFRDQWR